MSKTTKESKPRPLRALVLSGGGAKGAYEAGLAISLIRDHNEEFDIFCGTSIGAKNAAFLAQNDLDALEQLWHSIGARNLLTPLPRIATVAALYESFMARKGLKGWPALAMDIRLTCELITTFWQFNPSMSLPNIDGLIDSARIDAVLRSKLSRTRLKHVLITSVTDLMRTECGAFYYYPDAYKAYLQHFLKKCPSTAPYGMSDFAECIRASAAIPVVFSPVRLPSRAGKGLYVDGGVTPIGQAIDAGATDITIVYVDNPTNPTRRSLEGINIISVAADCYDVMQEQLLTMDYDAALRTNNFGNATAVFSSGKKQVRLRKFYPLDALQVSALGFDDQDRLDAVFERGRLDASDVRLRAAYNQ